MKEGKLVESGTHSELMEAKNEYYSLYNVQAHAFTEVSLGFVHHARINSDRLFLPAFFAEGKCRIMISLRVLNKSVTSLSFLFNLLVRS